MRKEDRRKSFRLRAYHLAKYNRISGLPSIPILTSVKDISAGGVCLHTEKYLRPSAMLELKINFPALDNPISVMAKVAWIRRPGKIKYYEVGAEFVDMDEATRKIIGEQIDSVNDKLSREKKKSSILNFSRN